MAIEISIKERLCFLDRMERTASMNPSPFVKWAGGKARLLSQYEPYFPSKFNQYFESFVGGGAVFFHMVRRGQVQDKPVFLMDRLEELINCYRVIQTQTESLIDALRDHEVWKSDADYYYEVRSWDRTPGYALYSDVERAARFIFLNRVCYNGLYRVNRKGQFNVPFGRYRNPTICDTENLRAVQRALQGVTLLVDGFERCLDLAGPADLVYLDPPYHPVSGTANFTSYTSFSFGEQDQRRLAEVFRQLDRRGCYVLLSNSHTDLVCDLYHEYEQVPIQAARTINANIEGRGAVHELLIVNHPVP